MGFELTRRIRRVLQLNRSDHFDRAIRAKADDAAVADGWMAQHPGLHVVRIDDSIADADPVSGPVCVVQEAGLIEIAEVPRPEPVVLEERTLAGLLRAPVGADRHRAAHRYLADLPGPETLSGERVEDRDVKER